VSAVVERVGEAVLYLKFHQGVSETATTLLCVPVPKHFLVSRSSALETLAVVNLGFPNVNNIRVFAGFPYQVEMRLKDTVDSEAWTRSETWTGGRR